MQRPNAIATATQSTNLADILERVLDKGIVIAGDIKIKLVDVELLTLQIRLVVCSVDRAREMGLDWWTRENAFLGSGAAPAAALSGSELEELRERLARLEAHHGTR
jgi:hypothetical protein